MSDLANLGLQFTTQGSAEADQALDNKVTKSAAAQKATEALAASQHKAVSAMQEMASAIAAQEALLQSQARATAAASAQAQKYASTADAMAATWGRVGATQRQTAATNVALASTWGKLTPAVAEGGKAAGLTAMQLKQISIQMPDVIQQLISGQRPFQILIQQGGQVVQALQMGPAGLGGSLRALVGMIGPAAAAIGGLAATFGSLALGAIAGRRESDALANSLAITGHFADLTEGKFQALAMTIGREVGVSIGEARKVMLQLVQTGQLTGDTIANLAPVIVQLARFTGQTTDEVTAQFAKMGSKVGDFAVAFNSHYHMLTEAQIEHIRLLEEQGRVTQAQLELSIALHRRLGQVGPENLGYLEKAWRGVGGAIAWAWEQLKGFGRAQDAGAQLKELERLQQLAGSSPAIEAKIAKLKAEMQAAQAQAVSSQTQQAGTDAAERMRTQWGGLTRDVAKANTEIGKFRADIEAIRKANPNSDLIPSVARQKQMEDAIRKKYAAPPTHTQRDTTDERSAQVLQQLDQAKVEELQAQLALTKDVSAQADLQKQIVAAQASVRDAQVARQIADIQDDKGLSGAKKAELVGQLRAVQAVNGHVAQLQQQAVTEKATADLSKEALRARTADLQNQTDVLTAQSALAHTAQEQGDIAVRILSLRQESERATQEQITAENGYNTAQVAEAQKRLAILRQTQPLQQRAQLEANQVAVLREELARMVARRQDEISILQAQAELAKSTYGRYVVEKQIAEAQFRIERLKAEEELAEARVVGNTKAIADALDHIAALDKGHALQKKTANDDLLAAYTSAQDAITGVADAFKSHDWGSMLKNVAAAIETMRKAFEAGGSAAGKIGAVAGLANAAGQIIGGGVGNVLSGAAGGAMAGFTLGGPIGAAIGGIIGGIGGILGNSAKKRQEEQARQQAEAQRQEAIRQQARDIEIRTAEAEGNAIAAVNMRRNDEIAAADASNRAAVKALYAAEDAAALEAKRRELTITLDGLIGKSAEALAMQRQDELKALQPELRDLQALIYIRQDEAAAAEKQKALLASRKGLEEQFYTDIGNAAQATAIKREAELAALDDTLKPLQQAVYAAEDWAAAIQKVNDAVSNATSQVDNQISAAQQSADAATQSAKAYRDAATSLQDAMRQLRGGDLSTLSPGQKTASANAALNSAFQRALSGDTAALGQLGGLGQDYLTALKGSASNSTQYAQGFGRVQALLDQASKAAGIDAGVMDYQSTLLNIQVGLLKDVKAELAKPNPDIEVLKRQENLLANIGTLLQDQTHNLVTINSTLTDQTGQIITGNSIVSAQTGQLVSVNLSSADIVARATQIAAAGGAQTVLAGTYSVRDAVGNVYQVGLDQNGRITSVRDALGVQTGQLLSGRYVVTDPATGQLVGVTVDQSGRISGGFGAMASLQYAVAEAVQQQTGQVVTGNYILSAQTGQLQSTTGAIKDQTGAVVSGLSVQDAIRNLTGLQTAYSAQMLQALGQTGTSNALFQGMLNGINSVVSVLADIRTVLGANKGTPAPAMPEMPNSPGPQLSSFDQAKAALLSGDHAAAQRYLNANPDIVSRYQHPTGNVGDINPSAGESMLDFAVRQFRIAGQFEAFADHGRNLFASGGAFTNGIVSRPTAFNMGVMGEAGSEGVLPLANVGGRLGVYAANDNSAAQEIRLLRTVIERLETRLARIEGNTGTAADETKQIRKYGVYARGPQLGDAVTTQVA